MKDVPVELANLMQRERRFGWTLDEISEKHGVPKWLVSRYTTSVNGKNFWPPRELTDVLWEWDFWTQHLLADGRNRK